MPATIAAHPDEQARKTNNGYLLEVEQVSKSFKGLLAVDRYSLQLRQGEILGIIGPNGAGKTTVFNLLTGYLRPTLEGSASPGKTSRIGRPRRLPPLGIGRTFKTSASSQA